MRGPLVMVLLNDLTSDMNSSHWVLPPINKYIIHPHGYILYLKQIMWLHLGTTKINIINLKETLEEEETVELLKVWLTWGSPEVVIQA